MLGRFLTVVLVFLAVAAAPQSAAGASELDGRALEYWQAVRETERFLSQEIVASEPFEDGARVIVLLEPPQRAFASRDLWVKKALGDRLLEIETPQHAIGFDGWARDLVLVVKDLDDAALAAAVGDLQEEFYGTAYKASYRIYVPKPWDAVLPMERRVGAPNLKISAATLNDWLVVRPIRFSSDPFDAKATPAQSLTTDALLAARASGVYYSDEPGLVILLIDRDVSLNDRIADLRRFALDTDTILGAVVKGSTRTLVIVGRERTTPLDAQEPLQVDTILTLAASRTDDLAQSYERDAPFAGKITDPELVRLLRPDIDYAGVLAEARSWASQMVGTDGEDLSELADELATQIAAVATGVDWAPILLSRELVNTEFGHLLNITDQMLKGWSQSGAIRYGNFPYPYPFSYPDRGGVLLRLQQRVGQEFTSLTFNWNTAGFGVRVSYGNYEIFALPRTGSLPLTYIPEDPGFNLDENAEKEIRATEDDYWNFFFRSSRPLSHPGR